MVSKKIESRTKYFARISKTKHKLFGRKREEEQGRLLGRVEFCSFCSSNQVRVGLHSVVIYIYMHDFMKIGLKIVV